MEKNEFQKYAADLDIIRLCREHGFPVRSHPFFRDVEKRWPFVVCTLENAQVFGGQFSPAVDGTVLFDCLSYFGPRQKQRFNERRVEHVARVETLDRAFLLGGDRTFGHFVVSLLMRAIYLQLFDDLRDVPVITMPDLPETCYELLSIFGCPRSRLVMLGDDESVSCRTLYVPTVTAGVPPEGDTWIVTAKLSQLYRDFVINACLPGVTLQPPHRRVFILRRNTENKAILNDDEVCRFFEDLGYEIVDPGSMPLVDQVRLAVETQYFVTSTGSQIHLADFAQPGARLLYLSHVEHTAQRSMDAYTRWVSLGLDFITYTCNGDDEGNIRVNIDALRATMAELGFPS